MGPVKGFVALAIVLLIPTVAYVQKQHFENRLKPQLAASVMEVLNAEGVQNPSVSMSYLDAVIRGRVKSDRDRELVAARVGALPGVRVPQGGNKLHSYGWVRISRVGGLYQASGVTSMEVPMEMPVELQAQAGWDKDLERREEVELPEAFSRLGEFLRYYFRKSGNRSVELRVGGLTMWGDATAGLRSDWLSKASEVVSKDEVRDDFTFHPSIYHFPGYRGGSLLDESEEEELRMQLAAAVIIFEEGSREILVTERVKVAAAAKAMLGTGGSARFVVGGHPAREGNVTANEQLARERAEEVLKLLKEEGVDSKQLEIVAFGITSDDGRANQVEIVVK